jgi:broad specificity phosphatase PhoE
LDAKANVKTTFYYMRHAESVSNVRCVTSSYPTPFVDHITDKGKEQTRKAIEEFKKQNVKIDLVVTSDILRTKETAEMFSDMMGCSVIYEERLREINFGEYNGKSCKRATDFFRKESREDFQAFFPGGESLDQKQKDAMSVIFELQKKYAGQNILIVSHKGVIKLIESKFDGSDPIEYMVDETWPKNAEIGKFSFKNAPYNPETQELDLHKPYVDDFYLKCPECGGVMKRTKEVIDCWFDSGAMPFAQIHYPFEKDKFKYPAEFICEGIDQTRG